MQKKSLKTVLVVFLTTLLAGSLLLGAPVKEEKKEEVKKEIAVKPKSPKVVTKQLIYCTATKKIIPVGQFLLKDGVVSAIIHPAPLSKLFITAKATPGYYLLSPNKKSVVKATIVKTPIESKGSDGAKVNLLLSDAEAMMFVVEGNGFKAGEKVRLISTSDNENLEDELVATSDGQLFAVLAPAVAGKGGGYCTTKIIRDGETLEFKFPWGSQARSKIEQAEISARQ